MYIKNTRLVLCALLILFALLHGIVLAENNITIVNSGTCGTNVSWTLDSTGTLLISGTGTTIDFAYASAVPWYSNRSQIKSIIIEDNITNIGKYAFDDCSNLASITIPGSITEIGYSAFYGCKSLTSIVLPESLTSIGNYAFTNCSSLTSLTIPNSVTDIGTFAFSGCSKLEYVVTSNSLRKINNGLFKNCKSLANITIPNGATSIGYEAFYQCNSLTEIEIPGSVSSIGDDAFYYCSSLSSVVMLNGVTSIGDNAFFNCPLSRIIMPDSVTQIGYHAFHSYLRIAYAEIPQAAISGNNSNGSEGTLSYYISHSQTGIEIVIADNATTIGSYAFADFSGLTKVTISNNVTSIGDYAFNNCTSLKELTLPDNITSLGINAFPSSIALRCYSDSTTANTLTAAGYTYSQPPQIYELDDNGTLTISGRGKMVDYNSASEVPWFAERESINTVVINDGITRIGNHSFSGCKNLTSVTIPDDVISIGPYAFSDCSSLVSIPLSNNITSIGTDAFLRCSSLKEVILPDGIKSIASDLFAYCTSLEKVEIPYGVTYIGVAAFYNCSSLTSISIPSSVVEVEYASFKLCSNLKRAVVPQIMVSGDTAPGASGTILCYFDETIEEIEIADGATVIGSQAFDDCINLKSVIIPDSVTVIERYAFWDCSNLESITIPASVTTIDTHAFYECDALKNVYAASIESWLNITFADPESNPLSIADNLYIDGELFRDIVIPENVSRIKPYTFYGYTYLTNVTIPKKVTSIGKDAFSGCINVQSVYVESINNWLNISFENRESNPISPSTCLYIGNEVLVDLIIPDTITSIRNYAFAYYGQLEKIVFPNSIKTIGDSAFYCCNGLTSITLPNSVTQIKGSAFYNCRNLTSISIPDSVISIGSRAFDWCENLTNVYAESLEGWLNIEFGYDSATPMKYADNLYINNKLLTEVTIPKEATHIGQFTFYNCRSITSITIPASVKSIGTSAFQGCTGLTNVYADSLSDWLQMEFSGGYANPLHYASNLYFDNVLVTDIKVPEGVTKINSYAFNYYTKLKTITMPSSVTHIGVNAFKDCSKSLVFISSMNAYAKTWAKENGFAWEHDVHLEVIIDATAPTCTKTGLSEGKKCSLCNKVLVAQTQIPALGHTEVIDESVVPTCAETGLTEGKHCSVCGEILMEQVILEKHSNTIAIDQAVLPTCTETGLTEGKHCSVCSEILVAQEVVPALDHTEVTDEAVEPTCTETGLTEGKHCSVCSEILVAQEVVPALDHTEVTDEAVEPTCTETGLTEGVHCSVCSEVLSEQEVVPALGHTEVIDEAIAPTCNETGLTEGKHCSFCSEMLIVQEIIPALGHTQTERQGFDATDFTEGKTAEIYCSVCGETLIASKSIPALCVLKDGILTKYNGTTAELVIPAELGITSIGHEAFKNNLSLVSVSIPEGVTSIGAFSFSGCTVLEEVVFPESLQYICSYAFNGCGSLKNVSVPIHVKMGQNVFDDASDSGVEPGVRMRNKIGENLHYVIYTDGTMILYGSGDPYPLTGEGEDRYVFVNAWDGWVSNIYWANSENISIKLCIERGIERLTCELFNNWTMIQEVILPESLRSIPDDAFASNPDMVATISIGSYAHEWCKINGIRFKCAEHIEIIDEAIPATYITTGLTEGKHCSECNEVLVAQEVTPKVEVQFMITLPAALTDIEEEAFAGNNSECIIIPNGCTSIGVAAFADNTSLMFVDIPASVKQIEETAFVNCSNDLIFITTAGSIAETYAAEHSFQCILK